MKHSILLDLDIEPGGFVFGQPVCTCGWSGDRHDVGTDEGRWAYEKNERQHRTEVRVSNGCGYVIFATGLAVIGVFLVGAMYLLKLMIEAF